MANEITFDIKKHLADLGTTRSGRTKELNLVSWNGNEAKYDIRDWDSDHEKMGKGITLTLEEMNKLAAYFVKNAENNAKKKTVSKKKEAVA